MKSVQLSWTWIYWHVTYNLSARYDFIHVCFEDNVIQLKAPEKVELESFCQMYF